MNFKDLKNAIKHLLKTSKCLHCEEKYSAEDANVIAATKLEALFDMRCKKCEASTLFTVVITPEIEINQTTDTNLLREHQEISQNDVLDMKNFLTKFDGNFKKIFTKDQ